MIKTNQDKLADYKASQLRGERDLLMAKCDWAMMPDAPTDKTAWAAYRQALRDIPEQSGFPISVIWPTPPTEA